MPSDAQNSVLHLEAVHAMAQRLSALDISIYEHSYRALAFGSWTIEAGKRKERARCVWDGRDEVLTVEQGVSSDSQRTDWQPVEGEGDGVKHSAQALEVVETFLRRKFAV